MKKGETTVDKPSEPVESTGKRSDVGYGRPPAEHQFKKGEKPPLRKRKKALEEVPSTEMFRNLLNEERRVEVGGKVRWGSSAVLVMMRAWQEAEKGSATLRRELLRLSLGAEVPANDYAPLVIVDSSKPASETELRLMLVDDKPKI